MLTGKLGGPHNIVVVKDSNLRFPIVLRIAAGLIGLVALFELLAMDVLSVPPIFLAAILIVLSITFNRWPRLTGSIAIIMSILVPIMVIKEYLAGQIPIAIPIVDSIVFSWILWTASKSIVSSSKNI